MRKLALIAAALFATTAVPAMAAPIIYTLSGTFTGTRQGNAFTVGATFTGQGDTANAGPGFGNAAVTSVTLSSLTANAGVDGTFQITSPAFFYVYGPGQYGNALTRLGLAFDNSGSNALGLESAAYTGYSGLTSFPTTAGTTYFQNASFSTNGGPVVITSFTNGSFGASGPAVAAPVPEPATWAMMLVGFGAVGFSMRRRKSAQGRSLQLA